MRPVYAKDTAYDLLVPYVNWTFRRMFRNLEFHGLENIPRDGAVIFSPNHVNTLLDALAVLSMMGNHPVVFAATIWLFPTVSLRVSAVSSSRGMKTFLLTKA